jgi:RNA polymerase sigma factor (sigma-70 family)
MTSSNPPPDAEALFLAELPVIEEAIRFVCRRNHCRGDEAEEFASQARLKLIESDYAVFRKFAGRSSLRTYLSIVLQRLFLDHRRQRWGTWRPSAAARRLGRTAVRLDILVHRDGRTLDEAIEVLRTNEGVGLRPDELYGLARRLPERMPRRMEGDDGLADLSVSTAVVEGQALSGEQAQRRRSLQAALRRLLQALPAEDRLILRLRYEDDLPVRRIADSVKLEDKPLYRRFERLLAQLRGALESAGFGARDVAELLGGDCWDAEAVEGNGKSRGESVHS